MKKVIRGVGLLMLTLCLCLSLTACSKGEEGKYLYEDDGGKAVTIELKGGAFTQTMYPGDAQLAQGATAAYSFDGTYKIKGEKLILTVDGQTRELTIKPGEYIKGKPLFFGDEEIELAYQK